MTNPAPGQVTSVTRAELEERRAELQYKLDILSRYTLAGIEEELGEIEFLLGEETKPS